MGQKNKRSAQVCLLQRVRGLFRLTPCYNTRPRANAGLLAIDGETAEQLDIPIHDAQLVNVLEAQEDLRGVETRSLLRKVFIFT